MPLYQTGDPNQVQNFSLSVDGVVHQYTLTTPIAEWQTFWFQAGYAFAQGYIALPDPPSTPWTLLNPGDGLWSYLADGSLVTLDVNGALWRNGFRYVVAGVALAAARIGVLGQNLFAKGKTDGLLWQSIPSGWTQPDKTTMDPAFVAVLMA